MHCTTVRFVFENVIMDIYHPICLSFDARSFGIQDDKCCFIFRLPSGRGKPRKWKQQWAEL